ncbi:hypothetical protein [Hyalangium rubrum]|uniref:Uncharacterized protein n=1 Tax=Hyalangium rubrum TaxID=3103134 RepID=A0ABU5H0W8_9BACT|nr:hypothetical protein [Hyalangium sp. s54d21]MDY7225745.1 hypothetical protein [Hyalangium sp. s54d21]
MDRLPDQFRERLQSRALYGGPYKPEEGCAAIQRRAYEVGIALSPMQAAEMASSLGQDPLLIALHEPDKAVRSDAVISRFITRSLQRTAASVEDGLGLSNFKDALSRLANVMLEQRVLSPRWSDLQRWFPDDNKMALQALGRLASRRELIRRDPQGDDDILAFRHDRVRDQLLSEAIASGLQTGTLSHSVLAEPFYAELVGTALLADRNIGHSWVTQVREANPLALFHALKLFREPSVELHQAILAEIEVWLVDPVTFDQRNSHLLWAVQQKLAETDSPLVLQLTKRMRQKSWPVVQARFRNGDAQAGALFCTMVGPGSKAEWRDQLIDHATAHYGARIITDLDQMLRTLPPGEQRIGALNLAGHLGMPVFAASIANAWTTNTHLPEELSAFIWAAARCGSNDPASLLEPICTAWAALPEERNTKGAPESRYEIAETEVQWAMAREGLPSTVIHYFITRAELEDLASPITYMLHGLDHPDVMEFLVRSATARLRYDFSTLCEPWDVHRRRGRKLGPASLARLRDIWLDVNQEVDVRCRSICLWGGSAEVADLDTLRKIEPTSPLYKDAIRIRMLLGDPDSHTGFQAMLAAGQRRSYWWQFARHVCSPDFLRSLDAELARRGQETTREWYQEGSGLDNFLSEIIQRLPSSEAEVLLDRHWEHLRFSYLFTAAALFVSTPLTCQLVAQSISKCPEPRQLLRFLGGHYGLVWEGHGPRAALKQLESLTPYLEHLGEVDILQLWTHCNRMGFHAWRQKHLDQYVSTKYRIRHGLDDDALSKGLDDIVAKRHGYIHHWIEQFEERGDSPRRAVMVVTAWLRGRQTLEALKVAAEVIVSLGARADLGLLDLKAIEPADAAAKVLADSCFALFRRSLQ